MGQAVARGAPKRAPAAGDMAAGCEAWTGSICSKEKVGFLLHSVQGCIDAGGGPDAGRMGEYYDHIDGATYLIYKKIGSGECSEVFEARRTAGGKNHGQAPQRFAIKVYRSRHIEKQKQIREEVRLLRSLGTECKHVTRLWGVSEQHEAETGTLEVKMVLDLCSGGALRSYLRRKRTLTEPVVRVLVVQLCRALHFLHSRRIAYGDLKPDKILLEDSMGLGVKLSDFGVASCLLSHQQQPQHNHAAAPALSDVYIPPEVLQGQPYSTAGDMWAVGLTVYQCLTGRLPFERTQPLSLRLISDIQTGAFLKRALSEHYPPHLSLDSLLFLERLLRVDPNQRCSVVEALHHRWLAPQHSTPAPSQWPHFNTRCGALVVTQAEKDRTISSESCDTASTRECLCKAFPKG